MTKDLRLNIYYTGLSGTAFISENDGPPRKYRISMRWEIEVPVSVEPGSESWYIIK
jgi:hypothetical protein